MVKKIKLSYYDCPWCGQDMRAKPHEGINGHNCKLCGQGINWRGGLTQRAADGAKAPRQKVIGHPNLYEQDGWIKPKPPRK